MTSSVIAAVLLAGLPGPAPEKNNEWSAAYVPERLQATATKIAGHAVPRDDRFGYGLINEYLAIQDTSRPAVPALPNLPFDSTFTVERPGVPRAQVLYYRNIVGIVFDDSTSGSTIRGLLARYGGTIIGGVPGVLKEYFVQIPDPSSTFAALESIVTQLNAEPGVRLARKVYHRWHPIIAIPTTDRVRSGGRAIPRQLGSENVNLPSESVSATRGVPRIRTRALCTGQRWCVFITRPIPGRR